MPLIGVPAALPSADLNPVEDLKAQALMDSLSPGSPASASAFYPVSVEVDLEAMRREHEGFLQSLSPGLRATFEGTIAERAATWDQDMARRAPASVTR